MFWKKKKSAEELPEEIVVPTKKGFSYVFNFKLKKVTIKFSKAITNKEYMNEKFVAKTLLGVVISTTLGTIIHELTHAGTALTLGVEVKGISFKNFYTVSLHRTITTAENSIIIGMAPQILEALLGLYLIRIGLKKKKPIAFGYGVVYFANPITAALYGLLGGGSGDFYHAAEPLKELLIANFGNNPQVAAEISAVGNGPLILLLAAVVYGTAFFGNKYVPMISEEFITARRMKKIVHQIKEKDYKLYEAMGKKFLWPADRYRRKILGKINPKLLEKE